MTTKAYSLWIYDRHCTLIYHHDWSLPTASNTYSSSLPLLVPGPDLLPNVSRCVQQSGSGGGASAAAAANASSSSSKLPLTEHAKLIYGLVFSLRNMTSKLATTPNSSSSSQFDSYTTPTYTLAHYQTPSMYTFVILTDPVQPPSRVLPSQRDSSSSGFLGGSSSSSAGAVGGGGGGIPGTGGMSLPGVLRQIIAGPWVQWVVRNPAMGGQSGGGLEYEDVQDDDDDDDDEDEVPRVTSTIAKGQRRRGVDSDGFRHGVEAVLSQNKLTTTPA